MRPSNELWKGLDAHVLVPLMLFSMVSSHSADTPGYSGVITQFINLKEWLCFFPNLLVIWEVLLCRRENPCGLRHLMENECGLNRPLFSPCTWNGFHLYTVSSHSVCQCVCVCFLKLDSYFIAEMALAPVKIACRPYLAADKPDGKEEGDETYR